MSGHSKWATIKHKKGAADAKRGKVFTYHAKLIALAAQRGGDADMNPSLRAAIDRAKMDNLPNTNIERAIKRGTGELKDGSILEEMSYEGYGSGGVAIYVQAITDNKNRTLANVRAAFTKHGGNLGASGCVAWMFERKGVITVSVEGRDHDEAELAIIEAGADDMELNESTATVYTKFEDLMTVKKALEASKFSVENAEISFVPKESTRVDDAAQAGKVVRLMEALEEDEDVTGVSSNADFSEEVMATLG